MPHVHVTPADVQKYLMTARNMLGLAKSFAALTSAKMDDDIVAFAEKVIATLEPHSGEQWLADAIDWVIHLFMADDLEMRLRGLSKE